VGLRDKLMQIDSIEGLIENYYFGDMKDFISGQNLLDAYQTISLEFPDITKLGSIGKSYQGRDIILLEIGNHNLPKNGTSIMINSLHHS